MSLVNDALKRAKAAHDKQAGAPLRGAPLHSVPPPPASRMGLVALICFALASLAAVGIWYSKKNLHPGWEQVRPAAEPESVAGKNIIRPNPAAAAPDPAAAAAVITTPAAPAEKSAAIPPLPAAAPGPAPAPAPVAVAAASASVPPSPPELKLQGILNSASRPAAILNGRTYYVGDRVGDATITAIQADRLTLNRGNRTVVLRMP